MEYIIAVAALAAIAAFIALRSRHNPKFLSTNEYWVYLPGTSMPPQDAVMQRVLGDAYAQKGRKPVGPREGLLMSDIRLHIALVLRSKNPHVFRPDLFDAHIEPTAPILEGLAASESLVKVRYISETPLSDRASVQLLPYLALAIAELGQGTVIYDCVKEELSLPSHFAEVVATHVDVTTAAMQVRAVWRRGEGGGWAETRGLRKIGLPELATDMMELDEQVLVTDVLDEAAQQIWNSGHLAGKIAVKLFDDDFEVELGPIKNRLAKVRILRIQAI